MVPQQLCPFPSQYLGLVAHPLSPRFLPDLDLIINAALAPRKSIHFNIFNSYCFSCHWTCHQEGAEPGFGPQPSFSTLPHLRTPSLPVSHPTPPSLAAHSPCCQAVSTCRRYGGLQRGLSCSGVGTRWRGPRYHPCAQGGSAPPQASGSIGSGAHLDVNPAPPQAGRPP